MEAAKATQEKTLTLNEICIVNVGRTLEFIQEKCS